MRKPFVLRAVAVVLASAAIAVAGAYASYWWTWHDSAQVSESISDRQLAEGSLYGFDVPSFGDMVASVAVGGALTGLVLGGLTLVVGRLRTVAKPVAGAAIAVGGAAVAIVGVLSSRWGPQNDRLVAVGLGSYEPYDSALSVDFDTDWTGVLLPAGLVGAAAALVLAGLVYWRSTRQT